MQEENTGPVSNQSVLADIWEAAWIPAALSLLAILLTWAVWYNTTEPGQPESAKPAGCSWADWGNCVSLNLLNKMFAHGAIAGGAGGLGYYVMLRRERQARQAAERRADEERQRADEERQRADEERRRTDEERQRADEERRQADEGRRQMEEDRRRADEDRQRLMDRILELTRPTNGSQEQTDSESA